MKDQVNILLVDDRPENLLALHAILERPDYRLVEASSGQEALKKLLKEEFAVILLDVMMPGMDGYEVASIIKERERNRTTPIIFLTAVARDVEHIFKGYSVGAVDYLSKPLAAEIVKAKVAVFVDLHRQGIEIKRQAVLISENEKREQERKLLEFKLAEEKRYKDLAESIPQIVWTAGPDGSVNYSNRRWIEYTGMPVESANDMGWLEAVHAEDREQARKAWRDSTRNGQIFSTEFRLLRQSDQSYRWHLVRAIPSRDSSGAVVEWFGTCTDIEDQKRAQFELQETLISRDEFFSIASHELKTPITSLKLHLQLLVRKAKKEPDVMISSSVLIERLAVANRQTDRLERLIENLLDVSRIRSNRLSIDRERLDFAALVKDVVSRFSEQAKMANCPITVEVDEAVEGYFDRVRTEQVVTNLVSNAIKYGGGKPIVVKLLSDEESATLLVRDQGIGISPEDQSRIFGRFERAVSTKDFSGLGLGLYITLRIVQAQGGKMEVESVLGKGSSFVVSFPKKVFAQVLPMTSAEDQPKWDEAMLKKSL